MRVVFLLMILFISACVKKQSRLNAVDYRVPLVEYSFNNVANATFMFQDGESVSDLTATNRKYEIAKVLQVKPVDKTTIEIANFAPVDIDDAVVLMSLSDAPKPIQLFRIKKISAHAIQKIRYPFIAGNTDYFDIDNAKISLEKYKNTGINPADVRFDFTGTTPLITRLKKLSQLKWQIKYHDYDPDDDPKNNWKENISPKDVRRMSGLMINLAYLYQLENAKLEFIKEDIVGNDGTTYFTELQKRDIYQRLLHIPYFQCGVCVNVAGLGGGAVFGVADHILRNYLKTDVSYVTMHEIGHMLDFSHSSSMTYQKFGKGACPAIGRAYKKVQDANEFPIRLDNYYKPSDFR